jgi:hypothetical protein
VKPLLKEGGEAMTAMTASPAAPTTAPATASPAAPTGAPATGPITEQEARALGIEAYLYLYPLVTMDVTRRQMTSLAPDADRAAGPMNVFAHMRAFPDAAARAVVRPNFDTLYSIAWLDLTAEPMILSVPDTEGRYYLLQLTDMWTDVFAAPGKRTSGTAAGHFGVVPPGWVGSLPPDVEPIRAPTPYVWIVGRTQTNGPADFEVVHRIQDGYTLTPLSGWGRPPRPVPFEPDPTVDTRTEPLRQVHRMAAADFFAYAAELLKLHPPHLTDWSALARMRRIGLEAGRSFELDRLPTTVRHALADVPAEALRRLRGKMPTLGRQANGWMVMTDNIGAYGNAYLARATTAMIGLGANQPEDAVYPLNVTDADGAPLTGEHDYVIHFAANELPPVDAFWSVTMYDAEGFVVDNPLGRFALGDRDALTYAADGSLELVLQHEAPVEERMSNWLPAPRGPLGVTMRLYAPKPPVLDGTWNPPSVRRTR